METERQDREVWRKQEVITATEHKSQAVTHRMR